MAFEIIDVVQGTPEWLQARTGLITASRFSDVLAKGEGKSRAKYMRQLAGEIITGRPTESYSNGFMERGKEQEAEAREKYAFLTRTTPLQVGFVRNGMIGCSPDSLIGDDGVLEIKTMMADILIDVIEKGSAYIPPEHRAQCQGGIMICERKWCDLALYSPGLPLVVRRWNRDEGFIANLTGELRSFRADLDAMVKRVQGMRS